MSSIIIQGDTSGSITIEAPAVAGTNTLTLPASTGTLVDKDASGNVSVAGTVTASSFSGDGSSLSGIAGGFSNMDVITSTGTWTNPGSVTKVKVTVVGGGGGGAGGYRGPVQCGGGGGGAGGTAIEIITIPTSPVPITIGDGGSGGPTYLSSGTAGGTSSFGAYCSATGGSGGTHNPGGRTFGGVGGLGSGGTINITGNGGVHGANDTTNNTAAGGTGGGSTFSGGSASPSFPTSGAAGTLGGGGSGAPAQEGASAGAGGSGIVVIEY